jgi:hypothetical protein
LEALLPSAAVTHVIIRLLDLSTPPPSWGGRIFYEDFLLVIDDTAGAVSIATISEKTAGTKMEISPLKYMIETSGFFHYTHICSSNINERRSFKIFNRFVDM